MSIEARPLVVIFPRAEVKTPWRARSRICPARLPR